MLLASRASQYLDSKYLNSNDFELKNCMKKILLLSDVVTGVRI